MWIVIMDKKGKGYNNYKKGYNNVKLTNRLRISVYSFVAWVCKNSDAAALLNLQHSTCCVLNGQIQNWLRSKAFTRSLSSMFHLLLFQLINDLADLRFLCFILIWKLCFLDSLWLNSRINDASKSNLRCTILCSVICLMLHPFLFFLQMFMVHGYVTCASCCICCM